MEPRARLVARRLGRADSDLYFVRKRRDIPFSWMFLCFGTFIIACGATHALIRELLADILEEQGFSVATARNGAEALALLGGIRPDLILLGLNMPIMNGREFRKAQRSDPSLWNIPTVVMSAVDRMPDHIADLAVSETLAKPVPLHDLLALVERHSTRRPPAMGA